MATCPACSFNKSAGEIICQRCSVQISPLLRTPLPASDPNCLPRPRSTFHSSSQGSHRFVLVQTDEAIILPKQKGFFTRGHANLLDGYYAWIDLTRMGSEKKGVSHLHARICCVEHDAFLENGFLNII